MEVGLGHGVNYEIYMNFVNNVSKCSKERFRLVFKKAKINLSNLKNV